MEPARNAGRMIGVLLLLQAVGGALANLVLLQPVMAAPGFLVNAAANSWRLSLAVLVVLAAGTFGLAIAIAAWPILRRYSETMAMGLLALAGVALALNAVENTTLLSMLSLSQAHANANAADSGQFEALAVVVRSSRNWAHYINLIVASGMLLVLHTALFRFALIPRALAGFAVLAVLLQLVAVTMPLFGHRIVFALLAPAGLSHLAVALWLLARGLTLRPYPPRDRGGHESCP